MGAKKAPRVAGLERLAPRLTSRAIIGIAFALVAIGGIAVLAVVVTPLPVEIAYAGWAVSGGGIGFWLAGH